MRLSLRLKNGCRAGSSPAPFSPLFSSSARQVDRDLPPIKGWRNGRRAVKTVTTTQAFALG